MENYMRSLVGLPRVEFEDPEGSEQNGSRAFGHGDQERSQENEGLKEEATVDPSTVSQMKPVGKRTEETEDDPELSALMGGSKKKNKKGKKKQQKGDEGRPLKHTFEVINSLQY